MQNKTLLPARSTSSGFVSYNFPCMDQSKALHVDVPARFVIVKDPIAVSLDAMGRSVARKNSLAISSAAVQLLKAVIEFDCDLHLTEGLSGMGVNIRLDREPLPALWDVDNFWEIDVKKSFFVEPKQAQLLYRLHAAFEAEPLEDGIDHPAEQIIKKGLQFSEDQQIFDWFENFSLDIEHPSFAASVLRCLGRQINLGTCLWRTELVRRGLTADNIEIRDATVQAAESWGDQELVGILKSHHETEPWLREYILDVINDLGE